MTTTAKRAKARETYHHGDLRAALLDAAEAELRDHGVERFSLRGVAKRAGVSHAAPAHHFRDTNGLLTALAARGFRRFIALQDRRAAETDQSPRARFEASVLGYLDFACTDTALFRLIFTSDRIDHSDPELCAAGEAGYFRLVDEIAALRGDDPLASQEGLDDVAIGWSLVHGIADLLASGRLRAINALPQHEREARILALVRRAMPLLRP